MAHTVPHQKLINIHRLPLTGSFLGINNDSWKQAARVLGAQAFLLYIYLASNKDEFKLALSPSAIQKEIGMPTSTFRDQLRRLESQGFVVFEKGNVYHFYEAPSHDTRFQSADDALKSSIERLANPVDYYANLAQQTAPEDIEIYINNKEGLINRPEALNRRIEQEKEENKIEPFNF